MVISILFLLGGAHCTASIRIRILTCIYCMRYNCIYTINEHVKFITVVKYSNILPFIVYDGEHAGKSKYILIHGWISMLVKIDQGFMVSVSQ